MDSNLGLLISILYDFNPVFEENLEQIQRVEELSDAYHFKFGDSPYHGDVSDRSYPSIVSLHNLIQST